MKNRFDFVSLELPEFTPEEFAKLSQFDKKLYKILEKGRMSIKNDGHSI